MTLFHAMAHRYRRCRSTLTAAVQVGATWGANDESTTLWLAGASLRTGVTKEAALHLRAASIRHGPHVIQGACFLALPAWHLSPVSPL